MIWIQISSSLVSWTRYGTKTVQFQPPIKQITVVSTSLASLPAFVQYAWGPGSIAFCSSGKVWGKYTSSCSSHNYFEALPSMFTCHSSYHNWLLWRCSVKYFAVVVVIVTCLHYNWNGAVTAVTCFTLGKLFVENKSQVHTLYREPQLPAHHSSMSVVPTSATHSLKQSIAANMNNYSTRGKVGQLNFSFNTIYFGTKYTDIISICLHNTGNMYVFLPQSKRSMYDGHNKQCNLIRVLISNWQTVENQLDH